MKWIVLVALLGGCLTAPDPPYGYPYAWQTMSETSAPGPMHGAKLTWDYARNAIVMYAGRNIATSPTPIGKMWMWKDGQWTEICAGGIVGSTRPASVYLPALTSVPDTQELILVGGARIAPGQPQLFGDPSDEVWSCQKDDTWKQVGTIKDARLGASLVYLPDAQQLALVGGRNATNDIQNVELASKKGDDFAIDPNQMPFPSSGAGQSATFDTNSGHILALETELTPDNTITPHDSIWESDGHGWQKDCSDCSGVGRSDASIVHLIDSGSTYVIGGYIGNGLNTSGTWIVDRGAMVKVDSAITDRNALGVASTTGDVAGNKLIAFGGTGTSCNDSECGQTYEYHPAPP